MQSCSFFNQLSHYFLPSIKKMMQYIQSPFLGEKYLAELMNLDIA